MLKQIFHRDVLFIILVNLLFINFNWQFPFVVVTLLFYTLDSSSMDVMFFFFILLCLNLRLTVLPFTYKYMEHNSNNIIVQSFIVKLKNSILVKTLVLILTLIPTFIYCIVICKDVSEFIRKIPFMFTTSIIIGAFGSYIALFIYWYIQKHFAKYKIISKILNLLVNKYTFVFSISIIALCYILIIMSLFMNRITVIFAVLFIALCYITSLLYFINKIKRQKRQL